MQIRIKAKHTCVKNLQGLIETGNNLPAVAISLETYQALKSDGVVKSAITASDIRSYGADANVIEVVDVCQGNRTLYLGNNHSLEVIIDLEENVFKIGEYTIPMVPPRVPASIDGDSPTLCTILPKGERKSTKGSTSEWSKDIRAYNNERDL